MTLILLVFISSLQLQAAELPSDCEARLMGDRIYGAVHTMLNNNRIGPKEVQKMLASKEPINPIPSWARTPENGAAQDLFEEIVQDPKVRAHWPAIQERLRRLMSSYNESQVVAQKAADRTQNLILPIFMRTLADSTVAPAFTQLPDGEVLVAYLSSKQKLRIIRLSDETELAAKQLATPVANPKNRWELAWHRDSEGKLALYLASYIETSSGKSAVFYKLKLEDKRLKRLPFKLSEAREMPFRLKSLGPNYLFLETRRDNDRECIQHFYNLAGDRIVDDTTRFMKLDESGRPPAGLPFTLPGQVVLAAPSGRTFALEVYPEMRRLIVKEFGTSNTFEYDVPSAQSLDFVRASLLETKDGEIFIATVQAEWGNDMVNVVQLGKGTKPTFSQSNEGRILNHFKLFQDTRGNLKLAFDNELGKKTFLKVYDVVTETLEADFAIPSRLDGWLETDGQIYFSSSEQDAAGPTLVFKLYSPSRPGGGP